MDEQWSAVEMVRWERRKIETQTRIRTACAVALFRRHLDSSIRGLVRDGVENPKLEAIYWRALNQIEMAFEEELHPLDRREARMLFHRWMMECRPQTQRSELGVVLGQLWLLHDKHQGYWEDIDSYGDPDIPAIVVRGWVADQEEELDKLARKHGWPGKQAVIDEAVERTSGRWVYFNMPGL
jgi:hypothetical protein